VSAIFFFCLAFATLNFVVDSTFNPYSPADLNASSNLAFKVLKSERKLSK
jgi:hypothetical protein